ncbi:MAG: DUF4065 domain-containing protein [Proteobacteria bacterium]|nr:DUF4065 domain-containing protein [Pseudomonadota bacterium]
MTISVFDAAKRLCEKSGWSLTNLELQKLIYLAHMFHWGHYEKPLITEHFEAWDYGPVQPDLYHHIKLYGSSKVKSLFHRGEEIDGESSEGIILDKVSKQLSHKPARWLVAVTHWDKGAWAKHYGTGSLGKVIPNEDILLEYKDRYNNAANRTTG